MNRSLALALSLIPSGCFASVAEPSAPATSPAPASAEELARGAALYGRHCALCHGDLGAGNGPASPLLLPPARDFTLARFRLVSTHNAVPTDQDLDQVLLRGMPGSAMPSWSWLSPADRACLVAYVRHLCIATMTMAIELRAGAGGEPLPAGEAHAIAARRMTPGETIAVPPPAPRDAATLALGQQLYGAHCASCHGSDGKGRERAAQWNENGDLNWARDLTSGILKGGASTTSLYRRIIAGMPGSAMPPTPLDDRDASALVAYLQTLVPAGADARLVTGTSVVRAARVAEPVPVDPSDPVWASVACTAVVLMPLSWHGASVNELAVSALHDDTRIAVRVHWQDATRNAQLFGESRFADGVALQFSIEAQPPLFGMGSHDHPVNIWHWRSFRSEDVSGVLDLLVPHALRDPTSGNVAQLDVPVYIDATAATQPPRDADSVRAEGFTAPRRFAAAASPVCAMPRWQDGAWDVVFVRPMRAREPREVELLPGARVPMACAVWNGAALDRGGHKSISIWQELRVD